MAWTIETLKEYLDTLREADREAVRIALDAAKEKSLAHNDLIQEMRRKEGLYVTKGMLMTALGATIAVFGAVMTALNFFLK